MPLFGLSPQLVYNVPVTELAQRAIFPSKTSEHPTSSDTKPQSSDKLRILYELNRKAENQWKDRLVLETALSRPLVSFQANKGRAVYRWFKYKEAFSAGLVEYLLSRYQIADGVLLDPFAGSGTALFAAAGFGIKAEGIELLPIGQAIIATKQLIDCEINQREVERLAYWVKVQPWRNYPSSCPLNELAITRGAYPPQTILSMERFLAAIQEESEHVRAVLLFALLCILESISYTRKDGQYLRWDHRSGRRQGSRPFDKGKILPFDRVITEKLQEIATDLRNADAPQDLFGTTRARAEIKLHRGSCLEILPGLPSRKYDCLITSPPYCNRYDYTRTYALELAVLGADELSIARLRQEMLSCTVENRPKSLMSTNPGWKDAILVADQHTLLQTILEFLESENNLGLLNNKGIPRMVRGYFYEMACVISECARVLKPKSPLIMVNDNVRYAGAVIPVDIILSEIAEQLGFNVQRILVLPNGKGNSSQQMGAHGRESLRKCVYVWQRA